MAQEELMSHKAKARLLMAGAALSIIASPAFALDGNDLVGKINAALALQGASIVADNVSVSGSTVTLTGTSFQPTGQAKKLPIGTVTMDDVEAASGGYTIGKVTFPNVDTSENGTVIAASDLTMSGVHVPADATTGGFDSLLIYDEAHAGPTTVSVDGHKVLEIGETKVKSDLSDNHTKIDFDAKLSQINADLGVINDPNAKEEISALGLTSLQGEISAKGSWTQNDGTITIDDYSLDFANVGKLMLAASLSGYTLDFIKSAGETAKAMEANPNKQEAQQAANLAMLGLLQRLTFNSANIRFEDDGITRRALDYAGKKQNTTGDQMAQMIKAMAPIVLAQYNIPDLQTMLTSAINTFLDKPENFTISAKPANPVPFPMVMGAAMGAPNTIPKVLGVKVSANN